VIVDNRRGLGYGVRCAVCMRPLAQRRHAASVACVSAGGSTMASEANERLRVAARDNDVAGIAAALLAGADPNAVVDYCTQLQTGALGGNVAAIAALLAAGARVNGTGRFGSTPLMSAVAMSRTAAIAALLAAGADVNHANKHGHTALHWASQHGHVDAARVLLEAGARTDVRSQLGTRPVEEVRARANFLARCGCALPSHRLAAASPCAGRL
jgi:uncharacterized protein